MNCSVHFLIILSFIFSLISLTFSYKPPIPKPPKPSSYETSPHWKKFTNEFTEKVGPSLGIKDGTIWRDQLEVARESISKSLKGMKEQIDEDAGSFFTHLKSNFNYKKTDGDSETQTESLKEEL